MISLPIATITIFRDRPLTASIVLLSASRTSEVQVDPKELERFLAEQGLSLRESDWLAEYVEQPEYTPEELEMLAQFPDDTEEDYDTVFLVSRKLEPHEAKLAFLKMCLRSRHKPTSKPFYTARHWCQRVKKL